MSSKSTPPSGWKGSTVNDYRDGFRALLWLTSY
jgi:hypothetical protein